MNNFIYIVLAWIVFPLLTMVAWASGARAEDVPCMTHNEMVERLSTLFDEVQMATAFESRNVRIELFMSNTGTWTLVGHNTPDRVCVMLTGTNWMMVDPEQFK